MRLLRLEFGISVRELAEAAGVSKQYMSGIELGKYTYDYSKNSERLIQKAFERVIEQRAEQARRLSEAYTENRHRLLELVTEEQHEL